MPRIGEEGVQGNEELTANVCGASFSGDENVLKLMVVMVAQLCGYTELKTIKLYNLYW